MIAHCVVKGEELRVGIYGPDELPRFQSYVRGLELADVIRD